MAEDAGYFQSAGRYARKLFEFFEQVQQYEGTLPDDPAVLGRIAVPVLVLHGSATKPFLIASAGHVADQTRNARIHEIVGAGHAAPLTHPEALAKALTDFFTPVQAPG